MARISKWIRNRFVLAGALIIAEFLLLCYFYLTLHDQHTSVAIVGWIWRIFALLYLINRDEIPEFKLPWLLILLLTPVLGSLLFALFGDNRAGKREGRRYQSAQQELLPYLAGNANLEELKGLDMDAWAQAKYLEKIANMPTYRNTSGKYFPDGESFWKSLLADLESAQAFVFLEYFIIGQGQMWDAILEILKRKARAGVDVYVMYDDIGSMQVLPQYYYLQLEQQGIHCIPANKFRPILSHIHNNRDHRKITVIDGKIAYTGGVNLADEYINAITRFGHWKDSALRLEGEGVRSLSCLFLAMWNSQSRLHLDSKRFFPETPAQETPGYVIPYGDGPKPMYREYIGKDVYMNLFATARDYLYITTPYLICDSELLGVLKRCAKRGVDVRILTLHIPDKKLVFLMTQSNYAGLMEAGVRIYEYTPGFLHSKNVLCDDKFAICGTINLDYRSLVHHFECGCWMFNTEAIPEMKQDFQKTLAISEEMTGRSLRFNLVQSLLAELMKGFSPLL